MKLNRVSFCSMLSTDDNMFTELITILSETRLQEFLVDT